MLPAHRTPHTHQRLITSPANEGGTGDDSRIDPTNNDEPLDNVTPLEPFRHAPAVRPVRERRRRRGSDQEQDLTPRASRQHTAPRTRKGNEREDVQRRS